MLELGCGCTQRLSGMSEVDVAALLACRYFDFNPLIGAAMKGKFLLLNT